MGTTKTVATTGYQKAIGIPQQKSIDDELRNASVYVRSGVFPSRFTKPEAVVAAMHIAMELGLKPLIALRQIAVIKGTPSLFGDLPLALVQSSNLMIHHKEYLVDENGHEICIKNKNLKEKPFGAVCEVKRVGDKDITERTFTMDHAKAAGLLSSDTWIKYPQRMLTYRARSMALKDKFADCLNGIAIGEYDLDAVIDNETGEVIGAPPDLQQIAFGKKDETEVIEAESTDATIPENVPEEKDPAIYYGTEDEQLKLFEYLQKKQVPNHLWLSIHNQMINKNKAHSLKAHNLERLINESAQPENP